MPFSCILLSFNDRNTKSRYQHHYNSLAYYYSFYVSMKQKIRKSI